MKRRTVVLAVVALAVPRLVLAQCPTRIPASTLGAIRNADIRNAVASKVIDQAFIQQNGGAQAMLEGLRQQSAEFDRVIRMSRDCVASSSVDPASVQAGTHDIPASCKANLELNQDAKRANDAFIPILQCWAGQPSGRVGGAPGVQGATATPPAWVGGLASSLSGIVSSLRSSGGFDPSLADNTDWKAVREAWDAFQDRVKATCGSSGIPQLVRRDDLSFASIQREYEEREKARVACVDRMTEEYYRTASAGPSLTGNGLGYRPMLDGANAPTTSTASKDAVDDILNTDATATSKVLPFEYEMPRTARPDRDFLKRIAGEMRSNGAAHELVFHVGDIDRGWLTTDQCVRLDVAFQATFSNGQARTFPVSSVPVNATDGTSDIRVSAFSGESGQPTDIRVTSATARACGAAPTPPPVDCTDSFQARVQLLQRANQIMLKRDAIYDGISVLQDSLDSVRADQGITESALTQGLMYLAGAGAVAEAALQLGGVTSPAIEAIRAGEDLGNYLVGLKEQAERGAPMAESPMSFQQAKARLDNLSDILQKAANADIDGGTSAAEYLLRGPRPQSMTFDLAIVGRLKSAWSTLDAAVERGRAYQAARETLGIVTNRLNNQLNGYRDDLASSKQALDLIHGRLTELTAACSVTGVK